MSLERCPLNVPKTGCMNTASCTSIVINLVHCNGDTVGISASNQLKQLGRIGGVETDAAVRSGSAQRFRMAAPMDGVPSLGEKNRIRHLRIVPFLGEVISFHSQHAVSAGRSAIAGRASRHGPSPPRAAVD